jgi:hypothetical protein
MRFAIAADFFRSLSNAFTITAMSAAHNASAAASIGKLQAA